MYPHLCLHQGSRRAARKLVRPAQPPVYPCAVVHAHACRYVTLCHGAADICVMPDSAPGQPYCCPGAGEACVDYCVPCHRCMGSMHSCRPCSCMLCLHSPSCSQHSCNLCSMSHINSLKLLLFGQALSSSSSPITHHVLKRCQGSAGISQGACMPQCSCCAVQEPVGPCLDMVAHLLHACM